MRGLKRKKALNELQQINNAGMKNVKGGTYASVTANSYTHFECGCGKDDGDDGVKNDQQKAKNEESKRSPHKSLMYDFNFIQSW